MASCDLFRCYRLAMQNNKKRTANFLRVIQLPKSHLLASSLRATHYYQLQNLQVLLSPWLHQLSLQSSLKYRSIWSWLRWEAGLPSDADISCFLSSPLDWLVAAGCRLLKALWTSSTASFISATISSIVDDFFIILREFADCFNTWEYSELNFVQTSLRCFFIDPGACFVQFKGDTSVQNSSPKMRLGENKSLIYLNFWMDETIEGFNAVSAMSHRCANLYVLVPWMPESTGAMWGLPSC